MKNVRIEVSRDLLDDILEEGDFPSEEEAVSYLKELFYEELALLHVDPEEVELEVVVI